MLLVPQFTWEEDAGNLALELRLPGIALKRIDIYVSDLVIKVNAAPYVLLLDLHDAVDDTSVRVKSIQASNILRLSVKKKERQVWNQLQYQGTRAVVRERRDASMARKRVSEMALTEKRKERRHQEEKDALRAQMAVDDTNRQILTDLKAEEKEREERRLYDSFRDFQATKHQESKTNKQRTTLPMAQNQENVTGSNDIESIESDPDEILELTQDGSFDTAKTRKFTTITTENQKQEVTMFQNEALELEDTVDAIEEINLPPPRERIQSEIRFTPRVFPTPSRESKAAEEENWLLKNRKHLKTHRGLNQPLDYDISETDPMWLKAKGDDFFHANDFQSATNAYAEAILAITSEDTDLMATCLSNRAACLLQLGEFQDCIIDCSKALSYLPDTRDECERLHVVTHCRLKLKLLVRRGTAYCRLGQFSHAKADYGVACSMDKQNRQLQDDFLELLTMEKAHELKLSGDDIFRQGNDLDQAIQMYSDSLQLYPVSIACLSNRAACYLVQHAANKCIQDCTRALRLLQQDMNHGLAFFSTGPAAGSAERRAWVVKTLVRRGAAYFSLHELDKAEQDYAASVELDPSNGALKADLAKVRTEREQKEAQRNRVVALPTRLQA